MGRSRTLDGLCVTRRNHQIWDSACNLVTYFLFHTCFRKDLFFAKGHGRTFESTRIYHWTCDTYASCCMRSNGNVFQDRYSMGAQIIPNTIWQNMQFVRFNTRTFRGQTNQFDGCTAAVNLIYVWNQRNSYAGKNDQTKPRISAHDPSKKKNNIYGVLIFGAWVLRRSRAQKKYEKMTFTHAGPGKHWQCQLFYEMRDLSITLLRALLMYVSI